VSISTPSTSPSDDRQVLVDVATGILRDAGARGLTVHEVLARAGLGTRAFYRHFESKDQLLVAVFAAAARAEADRLQLRMSLSDDPVDAVVAWVEGRLDLAFDDEVQSDLQHVSREAQTVNAAAPDTMAEVHAAMLMPLVEAVARGLASGVFPAADPVADARSIDAVTWSCIERQWSAGDQTREEAQREVLSFCLRALRAEMR
jgi:AcrR family transcriptional regulator